MVSPGQGVLQHPARAAVDPLRFIHPSVFRVPPTPRGTANARSHVAPRGIFELYYYLISAFAARKYLDVGHRLIGRTLLRLETCPAHMGCHEENCCRSFHRRWNLHPSGAAIAHGDLFPFNDHRHLPLPFGKLQHLLKLAGIHLDVDIFRVGTIGFPSLLGVGSPYFPVDDHLRCHGLTLSRPPLPLERSELEAPATCLRATAPLPATSLSTVACAEHIPLIFSSPVPPPWRPASRYPLPRP
jgi:hypothetical protein